MLYHLSVFGVVAVLINVLLPFYFWRLENIFTGVYLLCLFGGRRANLGLFTSYGQIPKPFVWTETGFKAYHPGQLTMLLRLEALIRALTVTDAAHHS